MKARNVDALYAIDEGGFIADGSSMGIKKQIATLNISEKGYVSFQLSVMGKGGHSSMPPAETAVGVLSHAVASISANKFPVKTSVLEGMALALAEEMPFYQRALAANLWIIKPILGQVAEFQPGLNAAGNDLNALDGIPA